VVGRPSGRLRGASDGRVKPLTPAERALLDGARPSERVVIRDFFELLDAQLVTGRGEGERQAERPGGRGFATRPSPRPVTSDNEQLFPTPRRDAA
jgi:hypothetical protein